MRLRLASVLPALLLAAVAAGAPNGPRLVVRDHTVSAKLDGVPLPVVLARLSKETGAELTGEPPAPRHVTARLRRVPIAEALKRLLGTQSFTLTYDGDGGLARITLGHTASEAAPVSLFGGDGGPAGSGASPVDAQGAAARLTRFFQANQPVRVRGRVAQFLGTRDAPLGNVVQAALKSEDPRVRAQARRTMVEALAADPEVRAALATVMASVPEESLVTLLRGVAGVDAQALAEAFARYGRSVELKIAMQRAIDLMRVQPAGRPDGR